MVVKLLSLIKSFSLTTLEKRFSPHEEVKSEGAQGVDGSESQRKALAVIITTQTWPLGPLRSMAHFGDSSILH